jgi:hypothetical protein
MYSFRTRDVVVSKRFSEGWAQATFPKWRALIEAARASYQRGHPEEDQRALATQIEPFYEFAMGEIRGSAGMEPPA